MSEAAMTAVLDHLHARRSRDMRALAAGLAPGVVHRGLQEGVRCAGRDEVLERVGWTLEAGGAGITRLEIVDAGDSAAVLCVEGPRFVEQAGIPLGGRIFIRFTVRDGLIERMDDFATRETALRGIGG